MKLLIGLFGLLSLFGCVHVETPHQIGDRVELTRDVYLIECKNKSLPDIGVNISSKEITIGQYLPKNVSKNNIGKSFLKRKIVGVLSSGTVLEVTKFDLKYGVDFTHTDVLLKNLITGDAYDLSNSILIDVTNTESGMIFFLTPHVFR
jgi:hypothetical protein